MRLIDADALLEYVFRPYSNEESYSNIDIERIVESMPTVDAEPVVRCKDCKHNQLPPTSGNAVCELWYGMTDIYGYCHYGKRREDE